MILTFNIKTYMGKYYGNLPFLSDTELDEFNAIGYTGRNLQGVKTNYEDFLNSLNKGEFQVTQIKFDEGDFEEKFIIVWVY